VFSVLFSITQQHSKSTVFDTHTHTRRTDHIAIQTMENNRTLNK